MRAARPRRVDSDAPDAPKSAAWLAAEAAFPVSQRPLPPASQPLVVVRRARGLLDTPGFTESERTETPRIDVVGRGSRVFRIETALIADPSEPAKSPLPSAAPADPVDTLEAAPRVSRGQRIAVDRRPGPVQQVFQAPPTRRAEADVAGGSLTAGQDCRPEVLAQELAGLDAVFDSIRRAQAVGPIDDAFAAEWQRLSRRADEIQRSIKDLLDAG